MLVGFDMKKLEQPDNIAVVLPRPKRDRYKGGMPLHAEEIIIKEACKILGMKRAEILSVFCGMCKYGVRVDINPKVNPHYVGDVHKLSEFLPEYKYDIILADPPYSNEEAEQLYGDFYGSKFPPLKYKKWVKECDKYLKEGGLLIIYHSLILPNPEKGKYRIVKRLFIAGGPWHSLRACIFYRKSGEKKEETCQTLITV